MILLNIQILEEYKSLLIKDENCFYIPNISKYSILFGLSPNIKKSKNYNYEENKKIIFFH